MAFIPTSDEALASAVSVNSSTVKVKPRAESMRTPLASRQVCFLVSSGVKVKSSASVLCWSAFVLRRVWITEREPCGGRDVGFCLRPGPAAPWALARQCRAVGYGVSVPRQDHWRGRTCHVTDQRRGRRHVIPSLCHYAWCGTSVSPRQVNRCGQKC